MKQILFVILTVVMIGSCKKEPLYSTENCTYGTYCVIIRKHADDYSLKEKEGYVLFDYVYGPDFISQFPLYAKNPKPYETIEICMEDYSKLNSEYQKAYFECFDMLGHTYEAYKCMKDKFDLLYFKNCP